MADRLSKFFVIGALFCAVTLAGCSSTSDQGVMGGDAAISDPLEDVNRAIFGFNTVVDDNVIHPVVEGYRFVVPKEARNSLGNFLRNLNSPVLFANELLQGDIEGARIVLLRAAINTFAGFGGLFDFAGKEGLPHQQEDFGQTLATWGLDHGPYFVIPLLGPTTTRDSVGYIVDSYADPLRHYLFNIEKTGRHYLISSQTHLVEVNLHPGI